MINKIKSLFLKKQFLIFLIIGCINTFVGTLFSSLYSQLLNPNLAFICGYITGIIISYLLNSKFTFKENLSAQKLLKFFISCIPNFLIQNGMVILFFNILGLNKYLVYVLAAIIGMPITFLLLKFFTFKKNENRIQF